MLSSAGGPPVEEPMTTQLGVTSRGMMPRDDLSVRCFAPVLAASVREARARASVELMQPFSPR